MPPSVNIPGEPEVTLTYLDDQTRNTEHMVRITFVRFSLRASIQVQTPQGSSLSDWEVGTLQTVTSGAIDLNCYRIADDPGAQVVIKPNLKIFIAALCHGLIPTRKMNVYCY